MSSLEQLFNHIHYYCCAPCLFQLLRDFATIERIVDCFVIMLAHRSADNIIAIVVEFSHYARVVDFICSADQSNFETVCGIAKYLLRRIRFKFLSFTHPASGHTPHVWGSFLACLCASSQKCSLDERVLAPKFYALAI